MISYLIPSCKADLHFLKGKNAVYLQKTEGKKKMFFSSVYSAHSLIQHLAHIKDS